MRLIPRLHSKTKVWPGGPEVGQVIEAQLNPVAPAASSVPPVVIEGSAVDEASEAPPAPPSAEVELLLVLR